MAKLHVPKRLLACVISIPHVPTAPVAATLQVHMSRKMLLFIICYSNALSWRSSLV